MKLFWQIVITATIGIMLLNQAAHSADNVDGLLPNPASLSIVDI